MAPNSQASPTAGPSQEPTASTVATVATQQLALDGVHQIAYRADIDGLRAVAVTAVVLFHAYPETFSSGFIGVDVFFVISGFLISSILFKENAKGSFTYAGFYSRRVRRIYPTLLVVLVTTWWLGCLYLLVNQLKAMASTMLAGSIFGANIQVMLLERGYFDDDIKTNPLLHLWSLGVEEQFYIFWPCFVSIVSRLSLRMAVVVQMLVLVLSFTCNLVLLHTVSTKYAFYFPLGRFWQMGVGGLLAYLHRHDINIQYSTVSEVDSTPKASNPVKIEPHAPLVVPPSLVSCLGLALIGIAFLSLDESSAFPGFWALLPTVGAALLIVAGPDAWFNRCVLAHPLAVFVGKISYALYLWHWPLLVFAKTRYPNPTFRPFYMAPAAMLLLAVALSLASAFHVENALRRRNAPWVVPVLVCAMVAMTALAASVVATPSTFSYSQQALDLRTQLDAAAVLQQANHTVEIPNSSRLPGFKNPIDATVAKARADWHPNNGLLEIPKDHLVGFSEEGRLLNPGQESRSLVVALGDTHLDMLKPRFFKLAQDTKPREFPTIAFKTSSFPALTRCVWWTIYQVNMIKTVGPQAVVYAINWLKYLHPGRDGPRHESPPCCDGYTDTCESQSPADVQDIVAAFSDEVALLTSVGIQVFVTTVHPEGALFDPISINASHLFVTRSAFRNNHKWLIGLVEHAISTANATILDLSDNYCWQDRCKVVDQDGVPIMRDSNTFTSSFAAEYLSVVDQVITAATTTSKVPDEPTETPNTSRHPRLEAPTVSKILQAVGDFSPDLGIDAVPRGSEPWGANMVMNPGQANVIFAWGDSHTNMIKPRFFKASMTRHAAMNASNFPTVEFRSFDGSVMLPCDPAYARTLALLKKERPKVLLHSLNWQRYLRPKGKDSDEISTPPRCCTSDYGKDQCDDVRPKDVVAFLTQFQADMAELVSLGIQVFIATMNPEGDQFDPKHMLSGDAVADVRPVLKSAYRQDHKELIELVEAAIHGANATLVDYSDNYCWQDVCQVVDEFGDPIMKDSNHLRTHFAFKYLSVIDQVVEAAMH
ncbi:Aste57867_13838 [Aphanomyces stellatus]|uniref:Aste57867_13838 protein n=1 Tax=Aphanomyces stellatus TaxID=120398 RepID=A0A485KZI6_9STRA|nr:hypothetical protein As57867_013787 [Aphanomyces stellatus]VFT90670.1 Aste57867_13838 [Aphanomyces stellatus]